MNYEEAVIYAATGLAEEGSTLFDTTRPDVPADLQQIVLDVAVQARVHHVAIHFHDDGQLHFYKVPWLTTVRKRVAGRWAKVKIRL